MEKHITPLVIHFTGDFMNELQAKIINLLKVVEFKERTPFFCADRLNISYCHAYNTFRVLLAGNKIKREKHGLNKYYTVTEEGIKQAEEFYIKIKEF